MKAEEETRRWAFEQCRMALQNHPQNFVVGDMLAAAHELAKWATSGEFPALQTREPTDG